MSTTYESTPTNWDRTEAPAPEDEAQEPAADGWTELQTLARSAMLASQVERSIKDVFDRRATLAHRLQDAAHRKDGKMAGEAARSWLQSEVRLYKLFGEYMSYMQERDALLKSLPADVVQSLG